MSHFGSVNSYEADIPLPCIGTHWIWELGSDTARALIRVTGVKWNGEEWWIETVSLLPDSYSECDRDLRRLNDAGRFWEAVTVVGGAIVGSIVTRRPDLAIEDQEAAL